MDRQIHLCCQLTVDPKFASLSTFVEHKEQGRKEEGSRDG